LVAPVDVVADLANLLAQVLEKHNDIRPPLSREDRFEQYCNRLGAIAPQLSNREIQICAEIVRGLSSQAIASKLGVSINTESVGTGSIRFQTRCTCASGMLENTCKGPVKSSWVTRGNSARPI